MSETRPIRPKGRAKLRLVRDWHEVVTVHSGLSFMLPIWLTIAVLPPIYAIGFGSSYEIARQRIDFCDQG